MIHKMKEPICMSFGITEEQAHKLILLVKDDWKKYVGGGYHIGEIYRKILNNPDLTESEKAFLCTHVAQHGEIFLVKYMVLNEPAQVFADYLGFK